MVGWISPSEGGLGCQARLSVGIHTVWVGTVRVGTEEHCPLDKGVLLLVLSPSLG